jgi:hypothetical protein
MSGVVVGSLSVRALRAVPMATRIAAMPAEVVFQFCFMWFLS